MDFGMRQRNEATIYIMFISHSRTVIDILNISLDLLDAIGRAGMSAKEFWRLIARAGGLQNLHDADHFVRIVARFIHETNAKFVCFVFIIAGEFQ
jgi:hypothetical protein